MRNEKRPPLGSDADLRIVAVGRRLIRWLQDPKAQAWLRSLRDSTRLEDAILRERFRLLKRRCEEALARDGEPAARAAEPE